MSEEGASKLPELKSDNYPLWSRKVNAYLRQHLLFNLVHDLEPRPVSNASNQREWDNKQMKAAGVIEQSLDESNASHCEGLFGDAVAMWNKLEQIHNAKTPGTRFNAMHTLFSIRKEDSETLESLMTRTKAAMQRVKTLRPTTAGAYTLEMLDNELVIATLLAALPDSFNHVTSSLYIQSDLSLEMVERSFRSEDVHRKQQATSDPVAALRAFTPHHTRPASVPNPSHQNSNNRPWCEHCQANTHWESRCWIKNPSLRPRRFNTRNHANVANANTAGTDATETHASNASTSPPPEARSNLNCDTGATRIMMGDEHLFASLHPLVHEIRLADGASIYSKGEGEVVFQPWVNGDFSVDTITFPNVLFAPQLKSNLVSVLSMVRKHGYEIRINSQQMEFYHGGDLRMTARIDENCIAYLNGRVLTAERALATSTCPLDRELWHRRLGHFHHAGIDKIIRHNLVEGLDIDSNSSPDPICVPCISGKQTRAVHTTPMPRADNVLDRVFMDLHGPLPVEAVPDRTKYWFPIVDDMSGYTHISLLRTKDAALDAFKRFKASAENQTDRKIKRLRDDKGGEFISKEFEKVCDDAGIIREHTHRATPEQNGVVERINRRISEGATALLTESNLPPSFWGLAVLAYVHVMNRCPSRSRGDKTPYELFHKKKASVKKLRVFGCAAYIHVQKEQRRALEPHTRKCIFVGYPSQRPGWMFWDPKMRKLIYSDSVTFDEREFPGTSQPKGPVPNLLPDIEESIQHSTIDEAQRNEPAILVAGRPVTHPDIPNTIESEPDQPSRIPRHGDDDDNNGEDDDDEGEDEINFARAFAANTQMEPANEHQPSAVTMETIYIPLVDAVEYALSAMETEPRTLAEALKRPDADKYIECAIEEVKAHLENGTWKVVRLPKGKRAIGSRWVFKIKRNADGSVDRYKGRIVAKGYSQREGVDYTETFAPTARFGALRAVIALAAIEDMELESIDIATAFLNGEIDAEVYMTKPEGLETPGYDGPEWVLRLLKALYGIKQGPRCWAKRLHAVMTEIGFRRLECDHSVFVYERDGVKIIVPVHVDDLVLASKSKEAIEKVKRELKEKFKLREQGATSFLLGVQLERDREQRTIALSQPTYIESLLKTYRMANCNGAKTPMAEKPRLSNKMSPTTPEEIEEMKNVPYREAVGKLLYLSIATRPDIAYAVSVLCRFTDNPGRAHWVAIKRVLRYLKYTQHYKLVYSPTNTGDLFVTNSDADLGGNVDNARSTAGFVISIGGGAVLWSSRLQRQVSLSSTEAEYTTAAATGCEIIWMREFFDEIGYDTNKPSPLYIDNASAIQVAKNPEHQSTMKHVHRSYHWLRERVEEGDIKVMHVPGAENVADIFTKPLGPTKFELCCKMLGLRK